MTPSHWLPEGLFIGSHAVSEGRLTKRQLRSGLYRRVLHNVYVDHGASDDHHLRARAAALLMPAGAALTGRSAAAWYGAPFAATIDPVLVVAPRDCCWDGPTGVRVHKCELHPDETTTVDGVRLATPLRCVWDVVTFESVGAAVALLDGMVHAGALTAAEVASEFARRRGQWRSTRADRVLPLLDGRAMSPPESRVRVACALGGLPAPEVQWPVVADGVWLGTVDLAWVEARLIVEYEGEYHFDGAQIRRDDVRYRRMEAAGWMVIRLSSYDLRNLDAVVRRIAAALAARKA